jgi:hypothetical protein
VFAALFHHAYSKRGMLGLNPLEVHDTRESVRLFGFNAILGGVVGLNGLILGATRGGRYEDLAGYAFGAAEVVAVLILVRFRATRRGRRSVVLNTMSSLASTENTTVHAG